MSPRLALAADITISANSGPVSLDSLKTGPGSVDVLAGVTVNGGTTSALAAFTSPWDVVNFGTLTSARQPGATVLLGAGGSLVNNQSAIITNTIGLGFQFLDSSGSVTNRGLIDSVRSAIASDFGGTVVNEAGGRLTSRDASGVIFQSQTATLTLTNAGVIEGGREGVLISGGTVTNSGDIRSTNTSTFSSGMTVVAGTASTISNTGRIQGSSFYSQSGGLIGTGSIGIRVFSDATATTINNGATGMISGSIVGLELLGSGITVNNSGTITSTSAGSGIFIQGANGTVTNSATGVISAAANPPPQFAFVTAGIGITSANGTVTNSGLIQQGVYLATNGTVTNNAGGRIEGTTAVFVSTDPDVVDVTGPLSGAITNAGTIVGQVGAVNVINTGSISSNVFGSNIINAGSIGGGVFLDVGNESLTLRTGSSIAGAVDGDAGTDTLFLEGSGSAANVFQNFEALVMRGTEWTLTGASTFGSVTVQSGFLSINGTLVGGPIALTASGAGLRGSGRIESAVTNTAGTVAPGGAGTIGTLTIAGNYTHGSGAQLVIDATEAGQGDKLVVQGQAFLQGGALNVAAADGGWNVTRTYSVLAATGGVSGQFSSVDVSLEYLTPTLAYSANEVTLTLERRSADIQQDIISETTEQQVSTSARRVSQAVDARVDQAISSAFIALPGQDTALLGGISGVNAGDSGSGKWGSWATFTPTFLKQNLVLPGQAAAQKVKGTSFSFLAGLDRQVASRVVAGTFFSYESSDYDLPAGTGERKGKGPLVGAYVGAILSDWAYASIQVNHAWLTNRISESTFGSPTAVTGKFDSERFMASTTLTARRSFEVLTASAKLGYSYTRENFDTYTASDTAVVSPGHTRLGRISVGGEVTGAGKEFIPYASATYEADVDTTGVGDRKGVVVGGGLRYVRGMLSFDVYGSSQFARANERAYSIGVNARYAF